MADDLNARGQQDHSRINVNESWEVAYWTKEPGVTREQLEAAVRAVGPHVDAVRNQLGR
jgi:hypothetical protein